MITKLFIFASIVFTYAGRCEWWARTNLDEAYGQHKSCYYQKHFHWCHRGLLIILLVFSLKTKYFWFPWEQFWFYTYNLNNIEIASILSIPTRLLTIVYWRKLSIDSSSLYIDFLSRIKSIDAELCDSNVELLVKWGRPTSGQDDGDDDEE